MKANLYYLSLLFFSIVLITSCSKQQINSNENNNSNGNDTTVNNAADTLGHSIVLYGTTATGGDNNSGSVFKINGDGTGFKTLYSFDSQDGNTPLSTLCKAPNGKLYGTTTGGGSGAYKIGVLFSFDPSTNTYKKILDFNAAINGDGDQNMDLMLANNGILYGANGLYLFSVNPSNDDFTILHRSDVYTEGNISNCVQGKDGKLYGISYAGGHLAQSSENDTSGIIYKYDIQNNIFQRLYTFTKASGAGLTPVNKLCVASDGNLYGLTYGGGTSNYGVIFKYNPSSNVYSKLIDLDGTNGRTPVFRNHLEEYNGLLYGIDYLGSTFGGCFFSYNTSTNIQSVFYKAYSNPTNTLSAPVGLTINGRGLMYVNGITTKCAIMRYDLTTNSKKIIFEFPSANITISSGLIQY